MSFCIIKRFFRHFYSKALVTRRAAGFTIVELMAVVCVVGILAAVMIPKFLSASEKAKASEFPVLLNALYSGQMGYQLEHGTYVTNFQALRDSAGIDIASSSHWFGYSIPVATTTSFSGRAQVNVPGFGRALPSDTAGIDQDNLKTCSSNLIKYCPNWR
jgi:type II secretory pathway pseudopilin PulG